MSESGLASRVSSYTRGRVSFWDGVLVVRDMMLGHSDSLFLLLDIGVWRVRKRAQTRVVETWPTA